jgi:hypothetical protein
VYASGRSEEILGRLIGAKRDRLILATKFSVPTDSEDANSGGTSRRAVIAACEASLRRLHTDYIDVFAEVMINPRLTPTAPARLATPSSSLASEALSDSLADEVTGSTASLRVLASVMGPFTRPASSVVRSGPSFHHGTSVHSPSDLEGEGTKLLHDVRRALTKIIGATEGSDDAPSRGA